MITSEQVYLIAAIALLYVICRTGIAKRSTSTLIVVSSLFIHSFFAAIGIANTEWIFYVGVGVLVWRSLLGRSGEKRIAHA
jgi:hypothetical protein